MSPNHINETGQQTPPGGEESSGTRAAFLKFTGEAIGSARELLHRARDGEAGQAAVTDPAAVPAETRQLQLSGYDNKDEVVLAFRGARAWRRSS